MYSVKELSDELLDNVVEMIQRGMLSVKISTER